MQPAPLSLSVAPREEREMTWRKHTNHREETAAVKAALQKAGITAKVGHGSGTAWAWLEINIGPRYNGSEYRGMRQRVKHIAQEVTGRSGEYDGDIIILAQ